MKNEFNKKTKELIKSFIQIPLSPAVRAIAITNGKEIFSKSTTVGKRRLINTCLFLASKVKMIKTQSLASNRLRWRFKYFTKISTRVNEHEWSPTENKLLLVLRSQSPEEINS